MPRATPKSSSPVQFLLGESALTPTAEAALLAHLGFDVSAGKIPNAGKDALREIDDALVSHAGLVQMMNEAPRSQQYADALKPIGTAAKNLSASIDQLNGWMLQELRASSADPEQVKATLKCLSESVDVAIQLARLEEHSKRIIALVTEIGRSCTELAEVELLMILRIDARSKEFLLDRDERSRVARELEVRFRKSDTLEKLIAILRSPPDRPLKLGRPKDEALHMTLTRLREVFLTYRKGGRRAGRLIVGSVSNLSEYENDEAEFLEAALKTAGIAFNVKKGIRSYFSELPNPKKGKWFTAEEN